MSKLEVVRTRLNEGRYETADSARRGVGHMKLSARVKQQALDLVSAHFGEGGQSESPRVGFETSSDLGNGAGDEHADESGAVEGGSLVDEGDGIRLFKGFLSRAIRNQSSLPALIDEVEAICKESRRALRPAKLVSV